MDSEQEGSCVQQITDLTTASQTYLDPLFYSARNYATGSNDGSVIENFKLGRVFLRDSATGAVSSFTDTLANPTVVTEDACQV